MRRVWTPDEMRDMAEQIDMPPYTQHLIDNVKAALLFAADLIDAADRVVRQEASILGSAKRRTGNKP